MTAIIIWLPKAERDLADITTYYQHISPTLVIAMRAELEAVQSQLRDFPHSFQAVNARLRRAFLTRFPYTLYFRSNDTISPRELGPHHGYRHGAWYRPLNGKRPTAPVGGRSARGAWANPKTMNVLCRLSDNSNRVNQTTDSRRCLPRLLAWRAHSVRIARKPGSTR